MPLRNYSNITNVGSLSTAVGTGETTLAIFGGWSNLPSFPFYVIVDRGTANEECMLATGGNAASLQVTRGYDGSPASSHGISATIEHAVLAEFFNKADAHVEASTNVHGLAGGAAVVGTTTTQTMSNKTINSSALSLAHSTSPAAGQAVNVAADNASTREGFVWTKTAAATGAAFKATSSGTTRFNVDADGKVQLNSTTGTDKALAIQQSGTERLFISNDGTLDAGLQAGGSTGDRVVIRNRPTQTALRIRDEVAASVFSVGSAGNVDASGYIASAAAVSSGTTLTAGTNLTVNGTSTLTGDVTLPLPGAGTTSRIIVNSRTGGTNLEARNQAGTATAFIRATGQLELFDKAYIHNGSSPVIAMVTNTANVPSPSNPMVVFDNSDGFVKRWNGASWEVLSEYNGSAPRGWIAESKPTAPVTTPAATEAVAMSVSPTIVSGRRYKVTASWDMSSSTAPPGVGVVVRLRYKAGAVVDATGSQFCARDIKVDTGENEQTDITGVFVGPGSGQYTIVATMAPASGTATMAYTAADHTPLLLVEDMGF